MIIKIMRLYDDNDRVTMTIVIIVIIVNKDNSE